MSKKIKQLGIEYREVLLERMMDILSKRISRKTWVKWVISPLKYLGRNITGKRQSKGRGS